MPAPTPRAVPILCARDLHRSLAFYMTLGFEAKRYAGGDGYAFLWWNGTEVHLSQSDLLVEGQNSGTGVYFYLEPGTAVQTEAAFRSAGALISSPLAPRAWGMNEFVLTDPDGNLLRFGEPIEPQSIEPQTQVILNIVPAPTPIIGVLALQGAFDVHAQRLAELGALTRLVRKPEDLAELDALVIPGGESTAFLKHLERAGFYDILNDFCHTKPVFGTCAGCILLAREVTNPPQRSFGVLDATVERNAYGRQNDSAIRTEETALPGGPLEAVYIRAPRLGALGPEIETLAGRDGSPTLVRQGKILAATFHPELSPDRRVHQLFLDMVTASLS